MRSFPKLWLICLWIAVLAASPYIYANRGILDPLIVILFLGVIAIVGFVTIALILSPKDK